MSHGRKVIGNPKDIDARSEIQWLATIAHNNLLDTGRVGDWGSHRIEHELSAEYGLTHGEGMAIVLPAWIRYISKVNPTKTSQLYVRVFEGDVYTSTDEENTLLLADTLENFFISLGLRTRLFRHDIGSDRFEAMAKRATRNGKVGHYIPLGVEEIVAILTIALSGSDR